MPEMDEGMSTTDVITGALEGLPGRETEDAPDPGVEEAPVGVEEPAADPDTDADPVAVSPDPATTSPVTTPAEKSDEDKALDEAFGTDGARPNRIPAPRVGKMLVNARTKAADAARSETLTAFGFEAGTTPEKAVEQVTELRAKVSTMDDLEPIMERDGERFLAILSSVNPFYGRALAAVRGAAPAPAAPAAPKPGEDDPEPVPDFDLGNGRKTYTLEGMNKRIAWGVRQGLKEALTEFQPVLASHKAQERAARIEPLLKQRMQEVQTWEGFTDHEAEILKVLEADQKAAQTEARRRGWKEPRYQHTVESAYRQVVVPKLKKAREDAEARAGQTEEQLRAKILKELNGAPAATDTPSSAAAGNAAAPDGREMSTEDIVRDAVKKIRR
jgi:hypothetical protein